MTLGCHLASSVASTSSFCSLPRVAIGKNYVRIACLRQGEKPLHIFRVSFSSFGVGRFESPKTKTRSTNCAASSPLSTTDMFGKKKEKTDEDRLKETELWFEVPKEKIPLIYSSKYDITFLGLEKLHPFDSTKWGSIVQHLLQAGVIESQQYVTPQEATEDDLLLAHTKDYLNSLNWSVNVAAITEVPPVALLPNFVVQRRLLYPFRLQVGGTVIGAKLALERGWAINIGGGFHHASGAQGGGFCAYADISLAVKFVFGRSEVSRVMIIDLDAHQGNGHERDFTNEDKIYIFDMYNRDIYPGDGEAKQGIKRKVEMRSGTKTPEFLKLLETNLEASENEFSPDLIIYNAGTDVLEGDPLGRLRISAEGVVKRDEMVFSFAHKNKCPILMVTSGGYQMNNAKVIADSIINLAAKQLISLSKPGNKEREKASL